MSGWTTLTVIIELTQLNFKRNCQMELSLAIPKIVATFVSASSQGQQRHSARTNIKFNRTLIPSNILLWCQISANSDMNQFIWTWQIAQHEIFNFQLLCSVVIWRLSKIKDIIYTWIVLMYMAQKSRANKIMKYFN